MYLHNINKYLHNLKIYLRNIKMYLHVHNVKVYLHNIIKMSKYKYKTTTYNDVPTPTSSPGGSQKKGLACREKG